MNEKKISIILICLTFLFQGLKAQDVETLLSRYTQENGQGYMQPMADVFGASLNSGLFHSAKVKQLGLQIYLGIQTSVAFIPEKRQTFSAYPDDFFTPQNPASIPVEVPTVFGEAESVTVPGEGGTAYLFPAGLNMKMVPFAMPQLTIGSVFGTDLSLRYFAINPGEDFGEISTFGWGLRHSISQYIPMLPIDIAAGAYFQNFKIGEYGSANAWILNIQASKRLLIFTFYGGLGYEQSAMDVEYEIPGESSTISFNLEGENSIRLTTGITFNLGPVKLNVDYNFASQSVLSMGLGLGIGR